MLQHRAFSALGEVSFRRSETGDVPVMALELGGSEAVVPLRALQRELDIADASEDGQMLARIASALDYVAAIRLGDPLPAEVLTGEASWLPAPEHRERALRRMRMQLLAWLGRETGETALSSSSLTPDQLESDPALRAALLRAFDRAAATLELPDTQAVVGLMEQAAGELSYIEALRAGLLAPVEAMVANVEWLAATGWRGDTARFECLLQVQRLGEIAVRKISLHFAEVDAQTGEVVATLRNIDGQRAFIRDHRDWLFRSRLAWEPLLKEWEGRPRRLDEPTWSLLNRTYQFLARRFMPTQAWLNASAGGGAPAKGRTQPVLVW